MLLTWTALRQPRWLLRYRRIPAVPRITFFLGGVVAKSTTTRERDATVFVNSVDLSLPVPRVLDSVKLPMHIRGYFNCGNTSETEENILLLMTRLPGTPIGTTLGQFSDDQVSRLTTQLSAVFRTLRALPPPSKGVCGIDGRPCNSYLMSFDTFGPFETVASFNCWMLDRARYRVDLSQASLPQRLDDVETRFTHGDMNPNNVLVDHDGNLTGLIDWESAGWMPRHWEASYALCIYSRYANWVNVIHGIFPDLEHEMWVEDQWRSAWGE
ncbi:hypothetical protein CALVIDRAFT_569901 [Calocera viscosa TUFC12733]|uniref:Aminoglycoside phosphotransferase domain-containing protein n=1 Tax=Calocera viscosa (strain TUFC12733) TaxID=1330018 RepID=A0A167FGF1_CALVF|nr:hypothetical protein CALVIDRAFT_569901 [Calocera viscosa TUFC12733]